MRRVCINGGVVGIDLLQLSRLLNRSPPSEKDFIPFQRNRPSS